MNQQGMTMMKTLMILSLVFAAGCSVDSQPGPLHQEALDGCSTDYTLGERFTPPEPGYNEASECMRLVANGETLFLRGAFRDACDAFPEGYTKAQVRWPDTLSVFVTSESDSFTVEECE